jgi:hypothetical protein
MGQQVTTPPKQAPGTTKWQPMSVRRGLVQKIDSLAAQLDPRSNPVGHSALGVGELDKHKKELGKLEKSLAQMTPPPIDSNEERASLEARSRQLEMCMKHGSGTYSIPDMPSKMEMKNNPDDSTRRHMTWEQRWKHSSVTDDGSLTNPDVRGYGAIMEWKDCQYRLYQEDDEKGLAPGVGSIERFRPDIKGVPLAKDHTKRAFSLSGNLSTEDYDKIFPDHKPLKSEIQVGTYFDKCKCGKAVLSKSVPYCIDHMEDSM